MDGGGRRRPTSLRGYVWRWEAADTHFYVFVLRTVADVTFTIVASLKTEGASWPET